MRRLLLLPVLATFAVAGCGGGSPASERDNASPAAAGKAIAATRAALRNALATYKRGDRAAAANQVGEAYVSHFEEAEGPLEGRDDELKESLEHAIASDLRTAMRQGRPAREVQSRVTSIMADLDRAEAALR